MGRLSAEEKRNDTYAADKGSYTFAAPMAGRCRFYNMLSFKRCTNDEVRPGCIMCNDHLNIVANLEIHSSPLHDLNGNENGLFAGDMPFFENQIVADAGSAVANCAQWVGDSPVANTKLFGDTYLVSTGIIPPHSEILVAGDINSDDDDVDDDDDE